MGFPPHASKNERINSRDGFTQRLTRHPLPATRNC